MGIRNALRIAAFGAWGTWCAFAAEGPVAPPAAGEAPPAEVLFERGRDALFKGDYAEAIELLGTAVAAEPGTNAYRLNLARACRYAGREDDAVTQLEEILRTTPDHVEAGQALAEIHAGARRWPEVVRVLEPLLAYRHDYPTYHMLAEAHDGMDAYDAARTYYEKAIALNPRNAEDHYRLGTIYLARNLFARAAGAYEEALRLGQDRPVLRFKLGSAYFNLRNYFGRIAVRTVKSGAPGTLDGAWYLIEAVPGRKDVFRCAPSASAVYQIARALADGIGERPDILILRATIFLNARRYAQAYDLFAEIEPKVPAGDRALFNYHRAHAAFGTGRYDEYLAFLGEAIRLDPAAYQATLVDAYVTVADQYNQAGDLEKHLAFLARAVEESPRTASLHLKLGNAYEEAQHHEAAVAQWRMVLDLEPDHPARLALLNRIAAGERAP